MGILEFLVATVPVVLFFSIPLYAINIGHRQKKKKLEIRKIQEEKNLELVRQENFLLENKSMQLELDRIKREREERQLEADRESRWLIGDSERKTPE